MKKIMKLLLLLLVLKNYLCGKLEEKYQRKSSITGEITFLEEIRNDFINIKPKIIKYNKQIEINNQNNNNNQNICKYPQLLGLLEFLDYGNKPIPWFNPVYIRTKGHINITNIARFGYLDIYGGKLKNGTIEIILPEEKNKDNNKILLKNNIKTSNFLIHTESSSYGFGYNDSAGLSPPINIKVISTNEFEEILNKDLTKCYCDIILPGKLYSLLGFVYYPQYGHTIFNSFTNFYQLLKLKGFHPNFNFFQTLSQDNEINLLTSLLRNPTSEAKDVPYTYYEIQWHDMYNELFLKLVNNIYSWDNLYKLSLKNPQQSICFERLTIGSPPYLDPLNVTVTEELWSDFMKSIISFYFEKEIQTFFNNINFDSRKDVLTNSQLNKFSPINTNRNKNTNRNNSHKFCSVTFIVRFVESIPNSSSSSSSSSLPPPTSRDIINLLELQSIAELNGCQVKYLLLQHLTIKEQILELRWNTTLVVLSDGTAIYNNIYLSSCHTILRYDNWKKPGIVPSLGRCKYIKYIPFVNETKWLDIETNEIGKKLHELNRTNSTQLDEMTSFGMFEFPNHEIEYYLREYQLTYINPEQFQKVLIQSIEWYNKCQQEINEGKR